MHRKRTRFIAIFIFSVIALFAFTPLAYADMGPKASVNIQFLNMGDELCYGTLLSKHPSTGPYTAWSGDAAEAYHSGNELYPNALLDYETWLAFVEYDDADGYYFLQRSETLVSDSKTIEWNYYPPDSFKILLYYPESNTYAVSEILHRYAFDTYYTVDMNGREIVGAEYDGEQSSNYRINAFRSYMWRQELGCFVIRVFLTVLIELAVALLFKLYEKKQLLVLACVNVITQLALNLSLNYMDFSARYGYGAYIGVYALLEALVIVIEALVYCLLMNRLSERSRLKRYYVVYAITANLTSLIAGLLISLVLPQIF